MGNIQQQKNWENAVSLTASSCENFDPIFVLHKTAKYPQIWQLVEKFSHLPDRGWGGRVNPSCQPDRFFTVFFDAFPNLIQKLYEMQAGTYGQWGALLAGGEVIYPTGYGTLVTAVINELYNVDNSDEN